MQSVSISPGLDQKEKRRKARKGRITMLMTMNEILAPAKEHGFAVPAFNIGSDQLLKAVMREVEKLDSPVILEMSPDEFNFVGDTQVHAMIEEAHKSPVPVVIHLDHGDTYETVCRAIQAGMTSVMIDASGFLMRRMWRSPKSGGNCAQLQRISGK